MNKVQAYADTNGIPPDCLALLREAARFAADVATRRNVKLYAQDLEARAESLLSDMRAAGVKWSDTDGISPSDAEMPPPRITKSMGIDVVIEHGRIWIRSGVQSFMLDYDEPDEPESVEWFAQRVREVLGL